MTQTLKNFFGKESQRGGKIVKKSQIKIKKGQKKGLHFQNNRGTIGYRKGQI